MKSFLLLAVTLFIHSAFAEQPICGRAYGFAYNQDSLERPYRLSGFWVKQNTQDIRITFGKSPELIETVETLKGSVFICLDEYTILTEQYAGKPRLYAVVSKFRIWLNGEEI